MALGAVSDSVIPNYGIYHLGIGGSSGDWSLFANKFVGSISQPMITHKAKYTSNFIPATDLSVGASSLPVDVFVNPGFTGNLLNQHDNSTITPVDTITTTGVRYLDTAIATTPAGLGAINLTSGWLYNNVSWTWTDVTFETWLYMSSRSSDTPSIFDTRPWGVAATTAPNTCAFYVTQSGSLGMWTATAYGFTLGNAAVSLNAWNHVAWVNHNGIWSGYINGVLAGTLANSTLHAQGSATQFGLGVNSSAFNLTSGKFYGSLFQPMITASAKYTGNFSPASDLSAGATNALFFLNPGAIGSLADAVTGQTMSVGGTIVTLGSR